mmetsp:Transcript_31653/g.83646  ORF Transcript_31653/g.83646 Transcript_31653/m.83646 type:complete len:292 (+) Transcript_31653:659-1534(+)
MLPLRSSGRPRCTRTPTPCAARLRPHSRLRWRQRPRVLCECTSCFWTRSASSFLATHHCRRVRSHTSARAFTDSRVRRASCSVPLLWATLGRWPAAAAAAVTVTTTRAARSCPRGELGFSLAPAARRTFLRAPGAAAPRRLPSGKHRVTCTIRARFASTFFWARPRTQCPGTRSSSSTVVRMRLGATPPGSSSCTSRALSCSTRGWPRLLCHSQRTSTPCDLRRCPAAALCFCCAWLPRRAVARKVAVPLKARHRRSPTLAPPTPARAAPRTRSRALCRPPPRSSTWAFCS